MAINEQGKALSMGQKAIARTIVKFDSKGSSEMVDYLAAEEPLEIKVRFGPKAERVLRSISITMRTPQDDLDLARGFLFTEGIIQAADDINSIEVDPLDANVIKVDLKEGFEVDLGRLERHFYTTSSCGVCGKTSMEALRSVGCESVADHILNLDPSKIQLLPEKLRKNQDVFQETGGLHAAGLFDSGGDFLFSREDVGRHNAVDKLIGHALTIKSLYLPSTVILVSGRASFELVQKTLMASIPTLVAVGAPSSLAADLAEEYGLTLIGFTSESRFNVYTRQDRISINS